MFSFWDCKEKVLFPKHPACPVADLRHVTISLHYNKDFSFSATSSEYSWKKSHSKMTQSRDKMPVSTVGESKMRYTLVRWQPNSRDNPTTVMPRSRVFFSISFPMWTDIQTFRIVHLKTPCQGACYNEKAWESWPVTRPTTWGLRMPTPSRRATKNPRWYVIIPVLFYRELKQHIDRHTKRIPLLWLWRGWKLRSFRLPKPKRKLRFIQ